MMHIRVKEKNIKIKILEILTQESKQLTEDLNYDTKHKLNFDKHSQMAISLFDSIFS